MLRLLLQLVIQRFHRLIAREVIGSHTTSHRSLWLIVQPNTDHHNWLHNKTQIAMTGCTTNHSFLGVAWPLLGVAQPLLVCPLQEEPGGYLHVYSLAFQQLLLLHLDVTSSPFPCLSWMAFLQHCSVRKLKEYWYWCLSEHLFICEGRPVIRSCNWSWPVAVGCTTGRDIVWPIVQLVWPWPFIDRHDWWHDWSYNHIRPICDLQWFGIAEPEFWTWPSTLLQLICL